jgi:peptide/nickel transport system substrate-binding protein
MNARGLARWLPRGASLGCVALLCGAAVLLGCSRVSTSGRPASHASTVHGVVRYAIGNDLNTLNPVIGGLAYENAIEEAIFSALVKLDDRERVIPDLATEVPSPSNGGVSADGRTITYHLRHGVKWQDGQPLTSADVAFTFSKLMDPNVNAPDSAPYTHIQRLTTPDDYTVVVRLKAPWAPAVGQLFCNGENGSIIPRHLLARSADFNHDPFGLHPIGSGAMRLARWDRGSLIVLVPNPGYFAGAPKIKEVDIQIIPDANTRLTMLSSRELDVAQIGIASQLTRLRQLSGYAVRLVPYTYGAYLVFNVQREPLVDRRVRESLVMALDRQRLSNTAYAGTAQSADSFIPPSSWAYARDNGAAPYDPANSNRLLTEAGWRTGADGVRARGDRKLALTVSIISGSPAYSAIAQQIQEAWRSLGVDVSIQSVPLNVLRSPTGMWTTGRFDVALEGFIFDPDPDRSANLGSRFIGVRGFNDARYVSAESDRLTAQAVAVYPHEVRGPLYARLQRLWNSDLPVVPIAWPEAIYVLNSDLRGFKPEPVNSDFWNVQEWSI